MLNTLPNQSDRIFNYKNKDILRKSYQRARKRIATNLGNPRLKQIRMHTFRHWRAQKELNKTSNVLAVMRLLGHKNLNNTQRYLGLMEIKEIEYTGAIAHNSQEALQLINAGFQFVQTIGDEHLYRKLK